jgi:ABC-type phosphate/phosphonate transport system permease subunit
MRFAVLPQLIPQFTGYTLYVLAARMRRRLA